MRLAYTSQTSQGQALTLQGRLGLGDGHPEIPSPISVPNERHKRRKVLPRRLSYRRFWVSMQSRDTRGQLVNKEVIGLVDSVGAIDLVDVYPQCCPFDINQVELSCRHYMRIRLYSDRYHVSWYLLAI